MRGINALVAQGICMLQRDDERLGAEVAPDGPGEWSAVVDAETGAVYLRDYSSAYEHWIIPYQSTLSIRKADP